MCTELVEFGDEGFFNSSFSFCGGTFCIIFFVGIKESCSFFHFFIVTSLAFMACKRASRRFSVITYEKWSGNKLREGLSGVTELSALITREKFTCTAQSI